MTVSVDPVKILVLGSGAREHALLTALAPRPAVSRRSSARRATPAPPRWPRRAPWTPPTRRRSVALAREVAADLVVVGPEVPLVAGVADALRAAGIACFGPSAAAAQIEGSKSFAKQVMRDAGVATAEAAVFDRRRGSAPRTWQRSRRRTS